MAEWTDDELEASVLAYRDMERLHATGKRRFENSEAIMMSKWFSPTGVAFPHHDGHFR
jgi:hypothetical protein